jgi:hypothetical protein
MIPLRTQYRLAATPRDYARAREFMRQHMAPAPLAYPTLLGEREGAVVGLLGTTVKQGAIIAAPLIARSAIVAMRLVEAYDEVMRLAGVRAYHFHVGADNAKWRAAVEKFGLRPWHEDTGGAWFRRTLAA